MCTDKSEHRFGWALANDRWPELFKNFAPHFMTHPSLLFTDTVELSVVDPRMGGVL